MVAPWSLLVVRLLVLGSAVLDRFGLRLRPRLFGFGHGMRIYFLLIVIVVIVVVAIIQRRRR